MVGKRKVHSATFKGKVAMEALKGLKPLSVLASEYEVHPNQISIWKKQLNENVPEIFRSINFCYINMIRIPILPLQSKR